MCKATTMLHITQYTIHNAQYNAACCTGSPCGAHCKVYSQPSTTLRDVAGSSKNSSPIDAWLYAITVSNAASVALLRGFLDSIRIESKPVFTSSVRSPCQLNAAEALPLMLKEMTAGPKVITHGFGACDC